MTLHELKEVLRLYNYTEDEGECAAKKSEIISKCIINYECSEQDAETAIALAIKKGVCEMEVVGMVPWLFWSPL